MTPELRSKSSAELHDSDQIADIDNDKTPTKADILEDISEGYRFVRSGGKGQPIDELHREIADELAREELAQNVDIRP
ncbi:MAG: hypothetical protein OXN94_06875 [Chloroflexota bacterium]|nr:hypothetical protein [Chloroflexota bacterium]